MNNLSTKLMLDSREVAEMVGKRHDHLLRDIDTYVKYLENPKMGNADIPSIKDFFKTHYYKAGNPARGYKCYKITKKGCEFIAHKLTGQKGAEFTAAYINKFHEMEDKLRPQSTIDILRSALDEIEAAQKEAREAKEIATATREENKKIKNSMTQIKGDWRSYVNLVLNSIGRKTGDYEGYRKESYLLLNYRAKADLDRRLENKIERMELSGTSKTAINQTNKLDVIESDPRLKEIYIKIVQEMEAKYL